MPKTTFYEQPVLNSPYAKPDLHHHLDSEGQPTDQPPRPGRRAFAYISPVPKPRKSSALHPEQDEQTQQNLTLPSADRLSSASQEYNKPIINEIRSHVDAWRRLPNPDDWGVTPATARLLQHWRSHDFQGIRPFFCQIEAMETIIWLTEVARKQKRHRLIWEHMENANADANPGLLRLAMKMATGAGKTTVMAMLIAWHTINAIRSPNDKRFTRGFLVITPGITIKDRLRVLQPSDPNAYYKSRELVPSDMLPDIQKARIIITNYHAFLRRDTLPAGKTARALLHGRTPPPSGKETPKQMLRRIAPPLTTLNNIIVINDEAHHCYEEKPADPQTESPAGEERKDAKDNNEAARIWINGIKTVHQTIGINTIYDLSATPFFLSGSGWPEGVLFPWTVSDFSLMDAIESGIVKLPRIPVSQSHPAPAEDDMPTYRNLWQHIRKHMPRKGGAAKSANPEHLPEKLASALYSLYSHYDKTFQQWQQQGMPTPPVFIVICNNITTSKLVYEWISGWQTTDANQHTTPHPGHLELFRNFDANHQPLPRPNTLLIDSRQLEKGGDLDANFRKLAQPEIDLFKRQRQLRGNHEPITDAELLREIMNTVGKQDHLGEQIRCVVSVSMLTEGWDANTVTHILGIRAFGTQLLCEQVVGRALRRLNYETNANGLLEPEYADILGIPFDFTAEPVIAPPKKPQKTTRVKALRERAHLEITFPRVTGYRIDLAEDRLAANFTEESDFTFDSEIIGPSETDMSGIVGKSHILSLGEADHERTGTIAFKLAAALLHNTPYFLDSDGKPKHYLFPQLKDICRRWLDEGHLHCPGSTQPWMLTQYPQATKQACEKIHLAILRLSRADSANRIKAVIDPYNPLGSTRHINFTTRKETFKTTRSHINYTVIDSGWEAEFTRIAENHPAVLSYVKNHALGFAIPYRDGDTPREYLPDFILHIDDRAGDDPLNLIIEIKGFQKQRAAIKKQTAEEKWVPGVNALATYGRWHFAQLEDPTTMSEDFNTVIATLLHPPIPTAQAA